MRVKYPTEVAGSMKILRPSHSGLPKALGKLCKLASLWALLLIPTTVTAYGLEEDDVVGGYGTIPLGTLFFMATLLIWSVRDSVQTQRKSLRDSMPGQWGKYPYMVWTTAVLLVVIAILASVIDDVDRFEGIDPTAGL